MHILLVEDDSSTRRFLRVIVEKLGYAATECETAEDGWEAFQRKNHPIALLDWMLPGMSGVELCRQIRATPKGEEAVILMSTSENQLSDIEVALKAGADDYLIKPVDIKQMKIRLFIAEQRVRALKDQAQIKKVIQNKLKTLESKRLSDNERVSYVIPIWEGVLLVPLGDPLNIKTLGLTRKRVLEAIQKDRAKQIIIDMTHVSKLDTERGSDFLKIIQTVKMIGAQPILVGVSARVAEILVEIVSPSNHLKSFMTLSDGLQQALRKMNYKIVKNNYRFNLEEARHGV